MIRSDLVSRYVVNSYVGFLNKVFRKRKIISVETNIIIATSDGKIISLPQ